MDTAKPDDERDNLSFWVVLIIGGLALLGGGLALPAWLHPSQDYSVTAQAFANVFAMAFLWVTLCLQARELSLQRRELRQTREASQVSARELEAQRKQMEGTLAEFKKQNDLHREQWDLSLVPELRVKNAETRFEHFDLEVINEGFGKARVGLVTIHTPGGDGGSEDIVGVLTALIERHGLTRHLKYPVFAPCRTPKTLPVNQSLGIADISLPFQVLTGDDLQRGRAFLEAFSKLHVEVQYTDIRNQQPQLLTIPFTLFAAMTELGR